MSTLTPTPPPTTELQAQRSNAAVRTYRYLRLSLVGMVGLLLFSVFQERIWGAAGNQDLGSISAYFYTPVRSVFVGALLAVGIGMIAIVGRRGFEDPALNIAGMLAPIVAFVPTPRGTGGAPCDPDGRCSVPSELVSSVTNNVWSLIVIGAAGVAYGVWTVATNPNRSRSIVVGCCIAVGTFIGLAVWFTVGRDSFLDSAHFAAAVPLFVLITAVVYVNATRASSRAVNNEVKRRSFGVTYRVVAFVMGLTLALAVVFFINDKQGWGTPDQWVFWVELVMLSAFGVFWIAQTIDFWNDGVPENPAG